MRAPDDLWVNSGISLALIHSGAAVAHDQHRRDERDLRRRQRALWRPLPYPHSERLAMLWQRSPGLGGKPVPASARTSRDGEDFNLFGSLKAAAVYVPARSAMRAAPNDAPRSDG